MFWFRKTMFDLQEKERMRIAADMHDTTMQDIFFIQRKLRAFQAHAPANTNTEPIDDIIQHLDAVNVTLRQNCFELHPPTLDTAGLLSTIANYLDMQSKLCSFALFFMTDDDRRIEGKGLETKRHLFRVVQELLHNGKKHAQATKVTVSCTSSETHFYLEYQDNGIGFDSLSLLSSAKRASGIGIEQMRGRILHIHGDFQLQSALGQGVQVQITIPLI
uniref:histidine kinase n=1 Tax=Paenibacillus athensensis TaxID=1967502 RepID=A0A4Y8PPK9_9BACL